MADNHAFNLWMVLVDKALIDKCGMTSDDLSDCAYRDWFDRGMKASTAATKAIAYAKES